MFSYQTTIQQMGISVKSTARLDVNSSICCKRWCVWMLLMASVVTAIDFIGRYGGACGWIAPVCFDGDLSLPSLVDCRTQHLTPLSFDRVSYLFIESTIIKIAESRQIAGQQQPLTYTRTPACRYLEVRRSTLSPFLRRNSLRVRIRWKV